MPSYQNILNKNEKKLDITEWCKDILDEGETEAFITIKKMSKELKSKVDILAFESMNNDTSKAMIEGLKNSDITMEELQNFNALPAEKQKDLLDIYIKSDIDIEQRKKLNEFKDEIEKIVFKECIDPEKHNFINKTDKGDNKIDISDYEFWNHIGKDKLVAYIYNEIKKFSNDFFFNQSGVKK